MIMSGEENGEEIAGSIYAVAPSTTAYLFMSNGALDETMYAQPGLDLIAESIDFDDELITVVTAGEEPLNFADSNETVEVAVPAEWYALETGESQFPIIMSEPEARYVVAVGTEEAFGPDYDPAALQEIFPEGAELDPALYDELIEGIIGMISTSDSQITLDAEGSEVFPREGALMIRLAGEADLEDLTTIPVLLYADMRREEAVMAVVFGDIESVLAQEAEIQALVESVTGL
jgi:hypothetical protein